MFRKFSSQPAPGPLLSLRSAVLLSIAVAVSLLVGVLTYIALRNAAGAASAGVLAFVATAPALHQCVGQ